MYLALFASCVAGALVLFGEGLHNIVARWHYQPEYSHGFLIPLVSAYILWEKRALLASHWGHGSAWGLILCAAAMALLMVGEISALYLIIHYAFLLFLLGLCVCLLGPQSKAVLPALGMLVFAIPLPYVIEVMLTAKMQLLSSSLGVAFIRLFGIPVHLSGNVIDLGEFKLHVVEACSGLRYLFPLASLGFVVAYFYRAAVWKKCFIFFSTVPITLVLNSVRIGITGIVVENWGSASAQGFLHDFEGWVVFVICMLVLLLEIILLERVSGGLTLRQAFAPAPTPSASEHAPNSVHNSQPLIMLLGLLIVSSVALERIDSRAELKPINQSFAAFPMVLNQWQGVRHALDEDIVGELDVTDYVMADYLQNFDNERGINLYVAFYDSQRKGISPHSPKVCIPGGGWEIAEFSRETLFGSETVNGMSVNRAVIRKGQNTQLVYYWFVERGGVVANEYYKKWLLFRDALVLNRSDGALVRVLTSVPPHEGIELAEARIKEFIAVAHPRLMKYLPPEPAKK